MDQVCYKIAVEKNRLILMNCFLMSNGGANPCLQFVWVRLILASPVSRPTFLMKGHLDPHLGDTPECGSESQGQSLGNRDNLSCLKCVSHITRYLFNRKMNGIWPFILIVSVSTKSENLIFCKMTFLCSFNLKKS